MKTAVEWLIEELLNGKPLMPSLIEQANKMFEEQIINAWNDCSESIITEEFDNAEQYYKETFKSE